MSSQLNLLIRKIPNYIAISEETRKDLYKFERKDSVVVHNSLVFDFSIKEKEIEIVCDRPIAEKMLDILHNPPKTVELEKIADFFVKRYSIKQQICKMEAVLLSKLDMR